MKLSIVVPCYNEEKVIEHTYRRLTAVLGTEDYNIIFVNDGSRDATPDILKGIAEKDSRVGYVFFSRNFGKEAAMLAGLSYSDGDAVVIIDADLQHPPELIPQMAEKFSEGYDQVIARRSRMGDSPARTLFAKLYYRVVNRLTDIHMVDGVGDFRLLSRKVVNTLLAMPEYHRFSKGLFSWIGFKQFVIEYENVAREAGESKWSFKSLLQYGVDGIMSFNNKPLRGVIKLGALMAAGGAVWLAVMAILAATRLPSAGALWVIAAVLLIAGIQLAATGVVGEYVGRIYYEVKHRPPFVVDESNMKKTD